MKKATRDKLWGLFQEYRFEIAPLMEKYKGVLSLKEVSEESAEYVAFLTELKPHWRELARKARKAMRDATKE